MYEIFDNDEFRVIVEQDPDGGFNAFLEHPEHGDRLLIVEGDSLVEARRMVADLCFEIAIHADHQYLAECFLIVLKAARLGRTPALKPAGDKSD